MSILIKGIEMPKDCPMCIAAHYNKLDEFTGCEIVSGKKYAVQRDAEYANSSTRPDWCPLVPVAPHGNLIDQDAYRDEFMNGVYALCNDDPDNYKANAIIDLYDNAPTIIPAEEG